MGILRGRLLNVWSLLCVCNLVSRQPAYRRHGGIVAYLALLCWLGGGAFGLLGGVVAACMTEGEGKKVSFYIIGINVALLLAAYLFLAYK